MTEQANAGGDPSCEHGTAFDVHCCNCHSGFLFDSESCVCTFDELREETPVATEKLTDLVLREAANAYDLACAEAFQRTSSWDESTKAGAAAMRAVLAPVLAPQLSNAHRWELEHHLERLKRDDASNFPLIQAIEAVLAGRAETPQDAETPCPVREDKQHCNCWYDGEACCACEAEPTPTAPEAKP